MAGSTKHIRPDYVARCEDATHEASLIKGHWYLYEKMSGGQSHKYIGRIREDGIRPGKRRNCFQVEESATPTVLKTLGVTVREFGFSKAVLDLCPDSWKDLAGAHWRDILIEIIVGISPNSYLNPERNRAQIRQHIGNHRRSLQKHIGILLDELWYMLGDIYWIQSAELNGLSLLSEQQKVFCQEHHICLEVIS